MQKFSAPQSLLELLALEEPQGCRNDSFSKPAWKGPSFPLLPMTFTLLSFRYRRALLLRSTLLIHAAQRPLEKRLASAGRQRLCFDLQGRGGGLALEMNMLDIPVTSISRNSFATNPNGVVATSAPL